MGVPSFKELLAADIKSVFLNEAEFADRHNIDGREMTAMLDDNEVLERDKGRMGIYMDGLYKVRRLLYVAKKDYGARPPQGKTLLLDGRAYQITACTEEAGILAIELEAKRA